MSRRIGEIIFQMIEQRTVRRRDEDTLLQEDKVIQELDNAIASLVHDFITMMKDSGQY